LKIKSKEILRSIRGLWQSYRSSSLPIDKILRGGELGFSSKAISIHYKDLLWGSKLAVPSPHSLLLQEYQKEGDCLFEDERFLNTEYYKYGANCIDHFYNFFEAYQKESIVKIARHFVYRVFHPEKNNSSKSPFTCYSNKHASILVSPIEGSSYFQLEDGYHRLAQAYVEGKKEVSAYIKRKKVYTPLQEMLLMDSRSYRKLELHQPLIALEVADSWPVRLPMIPIFNEIKSIIKNHFPNQRESDLTCLDVGARYGWLVKNLIDIGINTKGLENDYVCNLISMSIHNLNHKLMQLGDYKVSLLNSDKYNIVTCLDEMPRCFLKANSQLPDDFLKSLSYATKNILIISMGEIYRGTPHPKLSEWTHNRTRNWLEGSNLFKKIETINILNHNPLFICYK
jgi:hypothetical protein